MVAAGRPRHKEGEFVVVVLLLLPPPPPPPLLLLLLLLVLSFPFLRYSFRILKLAKANGVSPHSPYAHVT